MAVVDFFGGVNGCWRVVEGRERGGGVGLVAGAATATAGRNSKNLSFL